MKYNDLKSWYSLFSNTCAQFMTELEFKNACGSYVKRWRRFYGLNNKYDGKGNRREQT